MYRLKGRQLVKQPILVQPKELSGGTPLELHLNAEQLRVGAALRLDDADWTMDAEFTAPSGLEWW